MSAIPQPAPTHRPTPGRAWWLGAADLPGVSAQLRGFQRRRRRRPARHHRASGSRRLARRRCDLAVAVLHLADEGLRLRHRRLPRRRSALRHARGLRPADRARARAGSARSSSTRCTRTPPISTRGSSESRASRDNPRADWYVWADARPDGSPPCELAIRVRRAGVGMGCAARPVLPAQLPDRAAGSQRAQPGRAGRAARLRALLARARRGWLPARCRSTTSCTTRRCATIRRRRSNGSVRARGHAISSCRCSTSRTRTFRVFIERIRELVDSYPRPLHRGRSRRRRCRSRHEAASSAARSAFTRAYGFNFLHADRLTPRAGRAGRRRRGPTRTGMGWPSWAFSNHDAPRAPSALGERARSRGDGARHHAAARLHARKHLHLPGRGARAAAGARRRSSS